MWVNIEIVFENQVC